MNILVCPDKFKGSLSAADASLNISRGLKQFASNLVVSLYPLADGGEGMLDILAKPLNLKIIDVPVHDPLFRPITASYGLDSTTGTAYIEMAKASGLSLLRASEQNCLHTSTFGTGELVRHAVECGAKHLVLGLGGSATNDAGIGLACALGFKFYDNTDAELAPVGSSLPLIATIDDSEKLAGLEGVSILLACDVKNCFFGPKGAAHVYAPQKGANQAEIKLLDAGLVNLSKLIKNQYDVDVQEVAGSGAAGGLGGGCIGFFNAQVKSGIQMMIELTGLEKKIAEADVIITGEGKVDNQTLAGKVVGGVIQSAQKYNKPVVVLCGESTLSDDQLRSQGIFYTDHMMVGGRLLNDAMANSAEYLQVMAYKFIKNTYDDFASN